MNTKEYEVEIKRITSEADKILGEFKATYGEKFSENQKNMAEIAKQLEEHKEIIAEFEEKKILGTLGGSREVMSREVKGMMKFIGSKCADTSLYSEPSEYKTASISKPSTGGYFAVPEFFRDIVETFKDTDSIYANSEILPTNSNLAQIPYEIEEADAFWVGEGQTRPLSKGPTVGVANIPLNAIVSKVKVTQELLNGSVIPMEQFLKNQVTGKLGRSLGSALVKGNGFAKPKGAFADAEGAIPQVTTTGTGTGIKAMTVENIIDMWGKLPNSADSNAKWYMSKDTFGNVAKLKGQDQLYMLNQGLAPGMPSTILGFPVQFCTNAPDTKTAGNVPILFGDMKRAYVTVEGQQMTYLMDPYTSADNGMTTIRFWAFYGGQTVMPSALVKMVMGS